MERAVEDKRARAPREDNRGGGAGAGTATPPREERDGGRLAQRQEAASPSLCGGRLEGARHDFRQLFVETGMGGSQGAGVQMLFLVAGKNTVGRLHGGKLLLLVATGTENTAVTINR